MKLTDKIKRYALIARHMELVKGDAFDMEVASRILHFLLRGEISLGLYDIDWYTELELEKVGVRISYSRNGNRAYAHIGRPEKDRKDRC